MTTYFAAISQRDDDGTIYGVGTSASAARLDAQTDGDVEHPDRLHVTSMTPAAYAYVLAHGGKDCAAVSVNRNGVCLVSEES